MKNLLAGILLLSLVSPRTAHAIACTVNADCEDQNPCTEEICDPHLGCVGAPLSLPCNDGNACTVNDACASGACVGGNVSSACNACQAIAVLPAGGGRFPGTVQGSSRLQGECVGAAGSPERVYAWTPQKSGVARMSTCGTGTTFDTVLYVLDGACANGDSACNDDTPGCAVSSGQYGAGHQGSRVAFTVVAGRTYHLVVDGYGGGAGSYVLELTPPAFCGDNIREGPEACDGSDSAGCATPSCRSDCICSQGPAVLPDLVPRIANAYVQENAVVSAGDVAEGCARADITSHRLLRFDAIMDNVGAGDLAVGDPGCPDCNSNPFVRCANPSFICAPSEGHGHGHYDNYAQYELYDASGTVLVASGHKQGFCLLDSTCTGTAVGKFTCEYQGITAGCGDRYPAAVGCQYVEVTDVPAGQYVLSVRLDPFNLIAEAREDNNRVLLPFVLGGGSGTPPGPSASIVPPGGGSVNGITSGSSRFAGRCAGATAGAPEAVLSWVPAATGTAYAETCGGQTAFDTVLYVSADPANLQPLACTDDTAGCGVATASTGASRQGSRVAFPVVAGEQYFFFVDGYSGSSSPSSGAFTLTVTPPSVVPAPTLDVLPAAGGVVVGVTQGVSARTGPCAGATANAPEHVYAWTPVRSGQATLQTCSLQTLMDTVLYVSSDAANTQPLACNDDTSGCAVGGTGNMARQGSRVVINVVAGQTYYVTVDGYAGSSNASAGQYVLSVTAP